MLLQDSATWLRKVGLLKKQVQLQCGGEHTLRGFGWEEERRVTKMNSRHVDETRLGLSVFDY